MELLQAMMQATLPLQCNCSTSRAHTSCFAISSQTQVERFVFRPALSDRARYYAVITLNQLVLSRRSQEGGDALAAKLIDLYFSLFALIMGGKLGNAATLVEKEVRADVMDDLRLSLS